MRRFCIFANKATYQVNSKNFFCLLLKLLESLKSFFWYCLSKSKNNNVLLSKGLVYCFSFRKLRANDFLSLKFIDEKRWFGMI